MDEQTVMRQEDVEAAIDSGNQDIIGRVMSGEISIGEPVVEEVPEVDEGAIPIPDEYADASKEDILKDVIGERPVAEPVVTDAPVSSDALETLRAEMAEQKRLADEQIELLKTQMATKQAEIKSVSLDDETDDDLEYASTVAQNNRKLIEEIKAGMSGSSNTVDTAQMLDKIEKLEQAETQRLKRLEDERADNAQKETLKTMFNEIRSLQGLSEHFKTDTDIKDLYDQYGTFKNRVGDYIGSSNDTEINKAVFAALEGTSPRDIALQSKMREVGIDIPEEGSTYVKMAEIVDLKNGVQYDRGTGEYKTIRDQYGNKVNQRSLEDAYKLSNYYNIVGDAEKKAAVQIQKKLDSASSAARTVSNDKLANPSDVQQVSMQEAEALLSMPASDINRNPELKARFDLVMKQVNSK